jgi:hypothetical protein
MRLLLPHAGFAAAVLLSLAACGDRQELRPAPGQGMPVAPAATSKAPTVAELLEAPSIARPERVNELLKRSEERREDRFDLPPP